MASDRFETVYHSRKLVRPWIVNNPVGLGTETPEWNIKNAFACDSLKRMVFDLLPWQPVDGLPLHNRDQRKTSMHIPTVSRDKSVDCVHRICVLQSRRWHFFPSDPEGRMHDNKIVE